ncbi:DUF2703 domain-containing protein [Thiosocius teredinicola]|uniref:DUF2703 domain-containing protein n=1 Tax=Thiosocius teredinicola TaxID=1973002 RepID=UPI000991452F
MNMIEVEWKHLDKSGNTCVRCSDTGEALEEVVQELANECAPCGWKIKLRETKLSKKQISESNSILVNGIPIESILSGAKAAESHCQSCCEFTGNPTTSCRTVEFQGVSYEGIPAGLIRKAICEVAQCC